MMKDEYQTYKDIFLLFDLGVNELIAGSNWGILHWACGAKDWEFTTWLVLHKGADPNMLTGRLRNTSLILVAYEERFLKFLLWQGADPEHKNKEGSDMLIEYPLNDYLWNEFTRKKIIRVLLSHPSGIHKDLWREVAGWLVTD